MRNKKLRALTEGAIMVALATVLSMIKIDFPMGGGLTVCSMLPIVLMCHRHGTGIGLITAGAYSTLQLLLGMDNVSYGTTPFMVIGIILLDYIVAYTCIGLSGVIRLKSKFASVEVGVVFSFVLRFLCHLVSGTAIWNALWPNEYGMLPWIYSFCYNGSYMGAEILLTCAVAALLYKFLPKAFERQ